MRKAITYSSFVVTTLMVIAMFVTATTFTQLAIASILYLPLSYFFIRYLPVKTDIALDNKTPSPTIQPLQENTFETKPPKEVPVVVDLDKRAFLKLIGATGLSFFLISLWGRRVENLLLGKKSESPITPVNTPGEQMGSTQISPTEGYKISEIDDGDISYYAYVNKEGSWYIMREDPETGSFRYAKGNSNFASSWKNREAQTYGYYHDTFKN